MARIKLYSILRDYAGAPEMEVDVAGKRTYRELLEDLANSTPGLRRALEALGWDVVVVVNGVRKSIDDEVEDAGVIHVLPPSAGGAYIEVGILRRGEKIDFNSIIERLVRTSGSTGGIGLFVGVVRGVNQGEEVLKLEYEHAEDLAEEVLARIAREEAERHGLTGAVIYHYTGTLPPGELTIIVGVSGESRRNVYPALESIVDRVKHEAPIWKLEHRRGRRVYILGDRYIDAEDLNR